MCGICGAVWTCDRLAVEQKTLDAMTDMLSHRGPDDRGTRVLPLIQNESGTNVYPSSGGVAFGHRRLSIIDLSPQGRQPMCNEDQTVWVTFNGEIYNYRKLREMLLTRGHRFRSDTDTETLVHLYEEYGEDFPKYLSGMFALAIWDVSRRKLILARDRFGKKPLFYRVDDGRVLFASELKSLLCVPGIKRELDILALDGYLTYQYVPFPRTIYRDISKLPPASLAVWNMDGDFSIRAYWSPPTAENKTRTLREWQSLVRETLTEAVRDRLQSDVPLGAFLSGGIDSTIIVGLMTRLCREKVHTFSIGFRHKEYDETAFARRTAQRLGTDHHEFIVTPDAEAILPELVRQYDEPFADSSAIPTWYLSELTRTQVTVALSGDGGDELFAGYDRYKAVLLGKLLDLVPACGRRFLAGPVRWCIPASVRQRSFLRRVKRFLEALNMTPMERYLQWIAIFNRARKNSLYSSDGLARLLNADNAKGLAADSLLRSARGYDTLDFLHSFHEPFKMRDPVTAISMTDLQTYLPGDLMTKVDIASMRHSLEVRAPFLDTRVAELAASMPINLKLDKQGRGKAILRSTFHDFLPDELLNRPKTGFGVPLDYWFRGSLNDMLRNVLLAPDADRFGVFNREYVRRLIEEHEQKMFDHAPRLWSLLVFELWSQKWDQE